MILISPAKAHKPYVRGAVHICNTAVTLDASFDLLIDLINPLYLKDPYMYNLPYAYAYALSDMRRITLVLMHILIQPPSSYKSSFSYKTPDDAETHDPSTHATTAVTNVKRIKSILLSKEKLCLYIHESLEHHGSPWKLMIVNTSGGGGGE